MPAVMGIVPLVVNPLFKTLQSRRVVPLFLLALAGCAGTAAKPNPPRAAEPPAAETYSGPVIDVHAHVFFDQEVAQGVNAELVPIPATLLRAAAPPQLERVGAMVMAIQPNPEKTRAQNDQLLELVAAHPKLFPVASVHPDEGDSALAELERLQKRGVRLIKLHPNTQHFDVGAAPVQKVTCKAGELGMAVIFDSTTIMDKNQMGKFLMLAVNCPTAQIVLAHMGAMDFLDTLVFDIMRIYPWYKRNIWLELSYTAHLFVDSPYREKLVWVVRKVGVDRTLFGSDFPVQLPMDAVRDVQRLGFTRSEQQQIFHDNPRALLGL